MNEIGQLLAGIILAAMVALLPFGVAKASEDPVRIVALGDSLVAGYGLAPEESFPSVLQERLGKSGYNVEIVNAGVSGDTTSAGLSRLDWSVPEEADGVILALGANDALRGLDPETTRENLDRIIRRLQGRGQAVLLAGMMAPPNMGEDYSKRFNGLFRDLSDLHGTAYYPFLLDGVAANPQLNQSDGIHPNANGVEEMVDRMLPIVIDFVDELVGDETDE